MTAVEERTAQTLALEASRDELVDALGFVSAVAISTRVHLPVLAGVKISAASGLATVEAFDYERHAVQIIKATGEGIALAPARQVLDILKGCDKGARVTLTVEGDKLVISDSSARFTVTLLALDEYPNAPMPGAVTVGTLNRDMIAGILATLPAAGRDDTLPVLTGVCFDPAGTWQAVTTDRYRMALYDTGMSARDEARRVLVPAGAISDVKRLSAPVRMSYTLDATGDGFVTFADDARTITARLLCGEFPKYRVIFPDTFSSEATFDGKALTKAVKRAALVVTRTAPVLLNLGESVTVDGGNEYESTASVATGGTYTGEPMIVGANPAYLLDMVAAVGNAVTVQFTSSCRPFVAHSPDRPALRWLQMPVRLAG
jgi:DNA polymerase-3 subunit beta